MRNTGKPSDPNTKKMVKGLEYYWCDHHGWCSHKTSECKKPETGMYHPDNPLNKDKTSKDEPNLGNRNGRAVSAFSALLGRKTIT